MKYIHSKKIVHRDFKIENVLINSDLLIKIIDFGFSLVIPKDRHINKGFCGTPSYMAPEILNNEPQDFAVDMWAIGVFLYKLITGKFPFSLNGSANK